MSAPPILTALRDATRDLHDATEQHAYAAEIRERTLRPEQLTDLLQKQRRLHEYFDDCFAKSRHLLPAEHALLSLLKTRRAEWLPENDLPTISTEPYTSPAALTGALYVVLGSSMGSRMIAKQLARTPGLETMDFSFYERMGDVGGREWRVFLDFLKSAEWTEAEITEASAAARATFETFGRVFQKKTSSV